MSETKQLVVSKDIYHGLPTYPETPELQNLTAIITGANGISGYHMLKVLAAAPPTRWKKIYCLSRRPPPDYFFSDLNPPKDEPEGAASQRVEHVCADFLSDPKEIASNLQKISQVDYVFFFSYMQPSQKGNILGMWSNADALAETNAALLRNFLAALELASLKPRRVLLQTGAKQYGFHMGPATSPSFESDPRVLLENNFYYPQEDLLFDYCRRNSAQWNVVRPSYIIGAVRDNLLNHMVGLSVYGAVQAHLKRPLAFPGDYVAWDREYCQSTAMLNAYLEEWAVLSPHTGNEAFNAQDGLAFTWGRFWPYLARWYGTTFEPPEIDETKYRVNVSRHDQNPRGYGPPGTTRSTFSLLEWSEAPEVVDAWAELAKKHNLLLDPFKDRAQIFGMTDSAVIGGWALSLSMRKARKMGWLGNVDSFESAFYCLKDLARLRVAAPLALDKFEEQI
ncbi:hypothetical protein LTR99_004773 [Exophiala xenobiotica]|nr:hypothetical protein LTR96_001120 [Exophiala xenobiotica]KAK5304317.1 hypothetical protein LTR99_004773 [Exophiala xenobiotica]KAK5338926.1 hypothetical protein LTR98_005326 [Exophiala xenobiotica]KAK5433010.1 hypothetical protein LTR34_004483 [Exophiala xenobiotica]KAK5543144.1 hypothetical protein LTR23_004907 [Chaetothyriales sp. CCFEE 6169]